MENGLLQILVNGGLTSVALASLWLVYKLTSNHISHNTEAMKELSSTMSALKTIIKLYHDKDNGKK